MEWTQLAIQAGGAIAVCGMFLFYLKSMKQEEQAARAAFMTHLKDKDEIHNDLMSRQMEYLKSRDAQSKEIAQSGHAALNEIVKGFEQLKSKIDSFECKN